MSQRMLWVGAVPKKKKKKKRRRKASPASSLQEAINHFQVNLDRGTTCPCCLRYAKRYRRKLNSGIARVLIRLYREHEKADHPEWVHISRLEAVSREVHKLTYWGLARHDGQPGKKAKTSGMWQITRRGRKFALDRAQVPCRAVTYNKKVERLLGDPITIRDALGDEFDYQELMYE